MIEKYVVISEKTEDLPELGGPASRSPVLIRFVDREAKAAESEIQSRFYRDRSVFIAAPGGYLSGS